jgi:hypothetical protein
LLGDITLQSDPDLTQFAVARASHRCGLFPYQRQRRRLAGGTLLILSRLNYWLPRSQADPEIMQGTADFHHDIPDTLLPQADAVFDDATALDAAVDMLDPQ